MRIRYLHRPSGKVSSGELLGWHPIYTNIAHVRKDDGTIIAVHADNIGEGE